MAGVFRKILRGGRRMLRYRQYDAEAYWRQRAAEKGQARVLWRNEVYNALFREAQQQILERFLPSDPQNFRVLDIGCGIGIVAKMIDRPGIRIDAVDFEEMIAVAGQENSSKRITYIPGSAESYCPKDRQYDLIVSSACFSAIRDIAKLETALDNAAAICAPRGRILMIDPFHRWNFLARAKYNSSQVVSHMEQHGFELLRKSGVLFWPYREWLANAEMPEPLLRKRFARGENLLKLLGRHFWADYKVLLFGRNPLSTHKSKDR